MKRYTLLFALLFCSAWASAQSAEMPELYSPEELVKELQTALSDLTKAQQATIRSAQESFLEEVETLQEELQNCSTCRLKSRIYRLSSGRDAKIRAELQKSQRAELSTWLRSYQERFKS